MMQTTINDLELRFGEMIEECGKTVVMLGETIREYGFNQTSSLATFKRCHEKMGEVLELALLLERLKGLVSEGQKPTVKE